MQQQLLAVTEYRCERKALTLSELLGCVGDSTNRSSFAIELNQTLRDSEPTLSVLLATGLDKVKWFDGWRLSTSGLRLTGIVIVALRLPFLKIEAAAHATAKTDAITFSVSSEGPRHSEMPANEERWDQVTQFVQQSQNSPPAFR